MTERSWDIGDETVRAAQSAAQLRARAEGVVAELTQADPLSPPMADAQQTLHELRVHQIELELQNDELRRAHAELDASKARYVDLYELAPVGYLTLSDKAVMQEVNLRASVLLARSKEVLVGSPLTRLIVADDQDIFYQYQRRTLESGESQVCELRIKWRDGTPRWMRLEGTRVEVAAGGPPTHRVAMSDITDAREHEARLAQADRLVSMGVLAAGVAHEINNPLTYVVSNIDRVVHDVPRLAAALGRCRDALETQLGPGAWDGIIGADHELMSPRALAELATSAEQAAVGSSRVKEIARGLSFFARVEQTRLSAIDLNMAVEHALNVAAHEIRYRAAVVKRLGAVPHVVASEGKLGQVVLNLLLNAAHAIEVGDVDDNRITVSTWADSEFVNLQVEDTGCGIRAENRQSIFEPFFTTKAAGQGSGLGLAITHQLVNEFGGRIEMESIVGVGTHFRVRLRIAEALAAMDAEEVKAQPALRGRVLVVDDQAAVRGAIVATLDKAHDVLALDSGRAAKALFARDTRFDVVLCDLMMPDVPGIELHAWLTEFYPALASRLVFISGGAFTPRANAYLDAHPEIIRVDKPFSTKGLRRLVQELVHAVQDSGPRPA